MYEKSFSAISERYFKASSWPSAEAIARYADNDHVFGLLYKELYFRHVYGKTTPTLDQRKESWENYCNLFGVILHGNVNMQLPNLWLWEMIDEFIYQFQSMCQYRGKLSVKTKEELAALKDCDEVWSALGVLNFLQALVDKSGIIAFLDKERKGEEKFAETEGYDYNQSNVLRTLGYFALIGLHRVHILLGDYTTALKVLDPSTSTSRVSSPRCPARPCPPRTTSGLRTLCSADTPTPSATSTRASCSSTGTRWRRPGRTRWISSSRSRNTCTRSSPWRCPWAAPRRAAVRTPGAAS